MRLTATTGCYARSSNIHRDSRLASPHFRSTVLMHARPILSSNNGTGEGPSKDLTNSVPKSEEQWQNLAFPTYLQSEVDDFCQDWDEALQREERRQSALSKTDDTKKTRGAVTTDNPVWQAIRKEATNDAKDEPILSSFLYASILSHETFELALAAILANRLSDPTMMATELIDIFHGVLRGCQEVEQAALADVIAVRERDPSCTAYSSALLYYKGYHALQTHRIAHGLWQRGQQVLARSLQYRCTQTLAVDIHPAARIGKGVLLDHGTGLVIGETAVVGNNVSILHNVTLGGTGKDIGDRHPKVSDNVLIGANATILGNITIGKGAQVAAGSLVLKDVPPRTMVAGSPAKEVGKVTGNPALKMQHWMKNQLVKESYTDKWEDIVRSGNAQHPASPEASSQTKLPAEFGTKDKVPAPGTAPMGLSDYKDSRQWADRKQQLEQQGSGDPSKGSDKPASPKGYLGGDGAQITPTSETTSSRPHEPKQQTAEISDTSASGRNQDGGQVPKDAQASASGQGSSEQPKQSTFAPSGHGHYGNNGATPSSSSAKTNGAARHSEESIGDTSQLQARSRSPHEAAFGSNGASSRADNASNKQQNLGNPSDGSAARREAQNVADSQGQQDATVNSVQQAGQLSDAQQQQPEVLQQKPLRDTSWPQDEQKAQQQQQHEQEQQQQHRADVAASITEQTPKGGATGAAAPNTTESQDFDYWI